MVEGKGVPDHACRILCGEVVCREGVLGSGKEEDLGRGGRMGLSPDCIPKPTTLRWIPTTAI